MKAKREIKKFNFKTPFLCNGDKTHVSLVDAGANLQEVLVMKASESVTQTETRTRYDDDGNYFRSSDTVRVDDYGGDYLYITEEVYTVVDYAVKK